MTRIITNDSNDEDNDDDTVIAVLFPKKSAKFAGNISYRNISIKATARMEHNGPHTQQILLNDSKTMSLFIIIIKSRSVKCLYAKPTLYI